MSVLQDRPIQSADEDLLGFGPFVDALAAFVKSGGSPTTVAVQSPGGSGKSSLLNLLAARLEADGHKTVRCDAWAATAGGADPALAWACLKLVEDKVIPGLKKKGIAVAKGIGG